MVFCLWKGTGDLPGSVAELGPRVGDRQVSREPRVIAGEKCVAPVSVQKQGAELQPCAAAPPGSFGVDISVSPLLTVTLVAS